MKSKVRQPERNRVASAKSRGPVPVLSLGAFGARGDGVSDDTDALQKALEATADGNVLQLGNGTYAVRGLKLSRGMGGISGGALRGLSPDPVVTVRDAVDVRIVGVTITAGPATRAILAADSRDTVIEGCRISGLRDVSRGISLEPGCVRTVIRGCRIEAPLGNLQSLVLISVHSPMMTTPGGYFEEPVGTPKYLPETTFDTIIEGNTITGGTHGIALGGSCRTRIVNNTIAHNEHRNINICPVSRHNVIMGNHLREAGSSAVAMAYGSSFNVVANNSIESRSTAVGVDRDSIHSYVGCTHNRIIGNTITGDFRYGVYMAVDASCNVVQGNIIRLETKPGLPDDFTVGVGLENLWPERPLPEGARYSRQNFGSASPHRWGYHDSTGNVIQGNLVDGCTCGFYVSQIGRELAVRGNRWDHNTAIRCRRAFYAYGGAEDKLVDNRITDLLMERCDEGLLLPPWGGNPFGLQL